MHLHHLRCTSSQRLCPQSLQRLVLGDSYVAVQLCIGVRHIVILTFSIDGFFRLLQNFGSCPGKMRPPVLHQQLHQEQSRRHQPPPPPQQQQQREPRQRSDRADEIGCDGRRNANRHQRQHNQHSRRGSGSSRTAKLAGELARCAALRMHACLSTTYCFLLHNLEHQH